jgi:hypothetical protein
MFRAFAATTTPAGEAQWRLSSLENGLRIFEENPNTRSGRGGLFPDLSFSPGCKVCQYPSILSVSSAPCFFHHRHRVPTLVIYRFSAQKL